MEKETYTKDEYYKGRVEQEKVTKQEAIKFAEKNLALGNSEFADGYNTALAHFQEYLKK